MVINAAYKVLKDSDARIAYDRKRSMGVYGEAAKVEKTAGGSSYTGSKTQKQNDRSSSSSSSSSDGSNPFGNYGYNPNYAQDNEATESLGDIFGDLFQSVRKGDSQNFVGDLLDFLEDQIPGGGYKESEDIYSQVRGSAERSSRGSQEGSSGKRSKALVDSEIQILVSAISNLKIHGAEMATEINSLKKNSQQGSSKPSEDVKVRLQEMENNFRKLESIKGLDARILEVDKQIRQLNRQVQDLVNEKSQVSSSYTSPPPPPKREDNSNYRTQQTPPQSSSYKSSQTRYTTIDEKKAQEALLVDEEMIKLKKKMGLK
jgi:curved DNA-binding protein CbpA